MYHSVQRVPKCKNTYMFSWRICKRSLTIHVRKNQRGKSRIDNTEKLTTLGTQDDDKQNKKHNTICVGHHHGQTNNHIRHEPSYKQLEIYTNGGDGRQCYQETTQRATSLKNGQKKNIKRQTMIYKQLHSKIKIEQKYFSNTSYP